MWFSVLILLPFWCKNIPRYSRKEILLCLLSGLFLALHFGLWIYSLSLTSIASATVLVNVHPVFVLGAGILFLKERITWQALLYVGIALAGTTILSAGDFRIDTNTFRGDFFALLGAVSLAGYLIIGRKLRQTKAAVAYVFPVYLVSALLLTIINLIVGNPLFSYGFREYLLFFFMAFFCTILGHTLMNWTLGYLKTSFVSISALGEPIFATLLGMGIFSEAPTLIILLGGFITLTGLFFFMRTDGRT